jgi:hypothetical protein
MRRKMVEVAIKEAGAAARTSDQRAARIER